MAKNKDEVNKSDWLKFPRYSQARRDEMSWKEWTLEILLSSIVDACVRAGPKRALLIIGGVGLVLWKML